MLAASVSTGYSPEARPLTDGSHECEPRSLERPLAVPDPLQEESPDGRGDCAELPAIGAQDARRARADTSVRDLSSSAREQAPSPARSIAGYPSPLRASPLISIRCSARASACAGRASSRSAIAQSGWPRSPAAAIFSRSITSSPASRSPAFRRRARRRLSLPSSRRCALVGHLRPFNTFTHTGSPPLPPSVRP